MPVEILAVDAVWRNDALLKRQDGFDHSCNAARPFQVTDIRFDRAPGLIGSNPMGKETAYKYIGSLPDRYRRKTVSIAP